MTPIIKAIRSDPVYREVEEYGSTKIILMRKEGYIRYTPAHTILVEVKPSKGIDIAWDYKLIPAHTEAFWEWVKV
jgi:hypothetical protein